VTGTEVGQHRSRGQLGNADWERGVDGLDSSGFSGFCCRQELIFFGSW